MYLQGYTHPHLRTNSLRNRSTGGHQPPVSWYSLGWHFLRLCSSEWVRWQRWRWMAAVFHLKPSPRHWEASWSRRENDELVNPAGEKILEQLQQPGVVHAWRRCSSERRFCTSTPHLWGPLRGSSPSSSSSVENFCYSRERRWNRPVCGYSRLQDMVLCSRQPTLTFF